MRLRQAHAILEAATALEAAGLGIELFPADYDEPGAVVPQDHIAGAAWISDPDGGERIYNITIKPSSDGRAVIGHVDYGIGPDVPVLWRGEYDTTPEPDGENPPFRGLVGAQIAERIADEIRKHEKPFRAAYEQRSGKVWQQT
ncbi:hypothetical protein ACIF8T_21575 [Streptomyces sp. NPDC085946]|uniref:hypothetical protein n=1 Tax=Streptomyces sp. NPDC085946 TaxID=3365744 RepID=UPI0037CDCBB4